ncbi:diacylglycerol kinase family lipid kinase [bacterium]|nr:diacylglycerol kinase family lipid kinase [bacterium]MCB2179192.1 diacylglycerol kinase family lipid kinase [bacterium]
MPATVILNPYANRWLSGKRQPELEAALKKAGLIYEIYVTEYPEHGIALAKEAALAGNFPLIAAGGDGTLSEVVNGLMQAAREKEQSDIPAGPIGFVPFGTANDLTDVLGIPRDLDEVAHMLVEGHTTVIDLGLVNGRYFDNNSAIGLEPMITIENIRLKWLKGVIRYSVSALIGIIKNPTWDGEIVWDDQRYEGTLSLVSVGNSHRTGGVFYMTPHASVSDGFLDFVFAPALRRRRLVKLLPTTQTGVHVDEPEVQEHRTRKLTIRTKKPTPIQADGEVFDTAATEITYEVIPGAMRVIVPRQS